MGGWELISDRGRSTQNVIVRYFDGALHVQAYGLKPGEEAAIIIDHMTKRAYCFADTGTCLRLLDEHQYEGVCGPIREQTGVRF